MLKLNLCHATYSDDIADENRSFEVKLAKKFGKQVILDYKTLYGLILIATILISAVPVLVYANGTTDSMATYQYLISGAFDTRDGGDVAFNQMVTEKVAWLFKRVLPLISNFALACMVIVMAATIAYLSLPEFFDKVHFLSRTRKAAKYQAAGGTGMRNKLGGIIGLGSVNQFVTSYGIGATILSYLPDMKSIAFYSAFEAGSDGRPSMATYFKSSFPKHVAIMGMLMMINDRTLLELYFKGGEVVSYFFGKAAYNFDYPTMIENWLRSGKDFDPHFDGKDRASKNKKKSFNAVYSVLKQADKTPEGNTTAQKAIKGTAVRDWILNDPAWQKAPWDRKNFAVKASLEPSEPVGFGAGEGEGVILLSKPVSDFGISPSVATGYVVAYITTEDNTVNLTGSASTDDPTAWSGTLDGELVYDLDQSTLFAPYMARLKDQAKPVVVSCRIQFTTPGGGSGENDKRQGYEKDCSGNVKVDGHRVLIDMAGARSTLQFDPNKVYKVVIGVKASSAADSGVYMRTYVNPSMTHTGTTQSPTSVSGGNGPSGEGGEGAEGTGGTPAGGGEDEAPTPTENDND